MSFEDDLRLALRRQPAPPDFAARVNALAGGSGPVRPRPAAWRRWTALAAGVAVAVLLPAALERHRQEQREGARAHQQLVRALRLTGAKLRMTQDLLRETSER